MMRRGSFTVETACVMPLILFTLMGLLYMGFFVHNRTWLTAAAYESAVSGSMEGIRRRSGGVYETARMKSIYLGSSGFFGAENLSTATTAGKIVKVTYDLDTIAGYTGLSWHLHVEGSAKVLRPVGWIRKMKAMSETVKKLGEGT